VRIKYLSTHCFYLTWRRIVVCTWLKSTEHNLYRDRYRVGIYLWGNNITMSPLRLERACTQISMSISGITLRTNGMPFQLKPIFICLLDDLYLSSVSLGYTHSTITFSRSCRALSVRANFYRHCLSTGFAFHTFFSQHDTITFRLHIAPSPPPSRPSPYWV